MKRPIVSGGVFIVLLIILVGIVIYFFQSVLEGLENPDTTVSCKVVSYENANEPTRTQNLEKLLTFFGYDYEIVGKGEPWNGWYGRVQKYKKMTELLPKESFILFCDGRDVLPNETYSTFIKKAVALYEKNNHPIIFNAETACCNIGEEFNSLKKDTDRNTYVEDLKGYFNKIAPEDSEYKYLNFGVMFGKCQDFINMFEIMDIQPGYDDQGLISIRIKNKEFTQYYLDYYNDIFSIIFNEPKWDNLQKQFYNPGNSAHPSFFHFPGKTKWYETCAKQLMKTHLQTDPLL